MLSIDQDSLMAIQPELATGERVLWAGRPKTGVVFRAEDVFLIPFSLLWGGFAIFWEMSVLGFWDLQRSNTVPAFFVLWGIPFVVIGQYLIWGRFVYAAWKKKRTFYAVTSKRVIAVQDGWTRQSASAYIDTLPSLTKEGRAGKRGTLRFSSAEPAWSKRRGWNAWDGMAMGGFPVFTDIEDADGVYRLIADLREKPGVEKR